MYDEEPIEVEHTQLAPATLRAICEEFCTRDGTDYASVEMTLDDRVALLMGQLESGRARLTFDVVSKSLGILTDRDLAAGLEELDAG